MTLFISCSASSVHAERRFSKALRIADLKGKLELVTGAPAGAMNLILYGPASSTAEVRLLPLPACLSGMGREEKKEKKRGKKKQFGSDDRFAF